MGKLLRLLEGIVAGHHEHWFQSIVKYSWAVR